MAKRLLDILVSSVGLLITSPLLFVICFLVWRQDRHSPFYIADRVGLKGTTFRMIKIRSMIKNADKSGVESTGAGDSRITALGHFIRRYKIDELSQLWNVFKGDMSLVGPRPNTIKAVSEYSADERGLLKARPGITDVSSIVFSDEGDIIKDAADPDAAYNTLIRPWKSKFGLFYVENANIVLDINLILCTLIAIFDKQKALRNLQKTLLRYNLDKNLREIALRERNLSHYINV
jgi:lipopolysaccharide/colanic/teichoic acid biosynthesis glycosyltransferase